MPMTLYCTEASPPNRAVFMCVAALGLKPERKLIDLTKMEHMNPEFVKINPQHTVPTLVDDDLVIWDSQAICCYLVSKYGKDDSLYPKDLKKRALIDQRLHFNSGILFPRMFNITLPMIFYKAKEIPDERRKSVIQAYDFLEKFLEGRNFLAGDNYTVADICCSPTVHILSETLRISLENHPKTKAWLERCKTTLPEFEKSVGVGSPLHNAATTAASKMEYK